MAESRSNASIRGIARFFIPALSFLCCLLAISSRSAAESQIVDRIVAVVNDDIIVFQDLNKILDPTIENIQRSGQSSEKIRELIFEKRKQLLEMLIDQKLILQESKQFTVTVEEKEIDGAIERMKAANQLTDETLREALKSQGTNMQELRNSFKEQILLNRMEQIEVKSKIVVTKDDIKAYYDAHPDQYQGNRQYRLRHLMIIAPPSEKATARQKIETAQAALNAGTPFIEIVRQYASPQYADRDGELGLFLLNDLSPRLKSAIEKLNKGQSTPILETDQGYQIVHLDEIVETGTVPLEKVADGIEESLMKEALRKKKQEWIEGLRKRAHIKIIS